MQDNIPVIVEMLYGYLVTTPNPDFWPEYLRNDPVKAHGLWAFYQGLRAGIQLMDASLETL